VTRWDSDGSGGYNEFQVVRPVVGFPSAHAVVGYGCFNESDPIPHDGITDCNGFSYSNSAEVFYSLGRPTASSSNTGFETADAVTLFFVVDDQGKGLFIINYDAPGGSGSSNGAILNMTSTGLSGDENVTFLVYDDERERDDWDTVTGSVLAQWNWVNCCTDGAVLGYLPSSGFCLNLSWNVLNGIDTIQIGSYNALTIQLDFGITLNTASAMEGNDIQVCAELCSDVCAEFSDETTCDSQFACAWCNNSCLPDSDEDGDADDCDPCPFGTCAPTVSPG